MKKLSCILLIFLLSVITAFSVSAQNSVTINSVNLTESAVTINYNTQGLRDGEQITVLTYKADNADVLPDENNIKYINQIDKDSATSLEFSFNETPSGTYQIKMGGTDIETPDVLSITVTENTDKTLNYHKNFLNFFSDSPTAPELINTNSGKIILKPSNNYFAAFASIPSLDGYTVKQCGIICNGESYVAEINLKTQNNFGIIFKGASVETGFKVTAYPYITYGKDGADDITYYGSTIVNTLSFE